jgi:hypothetical protein
MAKKNRGISVDLDTGWKPVPPKTGFGSPQSDNNGILGGTGFQPVFACRMPGGTGTNPLR